MTFATISCFKERLDWDVQVNHDMEVDEFDVLRPVHLLHRSPDDRIEGCVRLLPRPAHPCSETPFKFFSMESQRQKIQIWQSIRFALDVPPNAPKASCGLAAATYELFAGMTA
ncbi:N-acyl-L-homoserine lactone synthetase [Bradyrhizobium niftali]|uniref:acyl-homoserine-lactone synthase n=1 Tax=Bradyrhizobium niftali TaxID=2560055 RepID=UPI0038351DB0